MRNVSRAVGSMLVSLAFGAACGETSPPDDTPAPDETDTAEAAQALCASDGCSREGVGKGGPFLTALRVDTGDEAAIRAVAAASDGSVWVAGRFTGILDVDGKHLAAAGGVDGFVARLDRCGGLVWALALGGAGDDEVLDLAVDPLGRGHLLLPFAETIDVGGTPVTGGGLGRDALVLSIDREGRTRWSQTLHTVDGGAFPTSLAIDAMGDVLLLGSLEGEAWLGDVRLRSGVVRGFLGWIDGDGGRARRAAVLPTATDWEPLDVEASPLGGAFVAGHDARGVGVFAMHVAATADVTWTTSFRAAGQTDETFHDLAVDDDGKPVLTARGFLGEGTVPGEEPPHLVTKLDDGGAPMWMLESEDPLQLIDDGPAGDLLAAGTTPCPGSRGLEASRCSQVALTRIDDGGDDLKPRRALRGAFPTALDVDDDGAAIVAGTTTAPRRPGATCAEALVTGDLFVARTGVFVGRPGTFTPRRPVRVGDLGVRPTGTGALDAVSRR